MARDLGDVHCELPVMESRGSDDTTVRNETARVQAGFTSEEVVVDEVAITVLSEEAVGDGAVTTILGDGAVTTVLGASLAEATVAQGAPEQSQEVEGAQVQPLGRGHRVPQPNVRL